MPSEQQGSVRKRHLPGCRSRTSGACNCAGNHVARYYDEDDKRRGRAGFATKSDAGQWLDPKVAGGRRASARRSVRHAPTAMPTLGELVDEYLAQHNAEANTIRTLKARLRYATDGPALDG